MLNTTSYEHAQGEGKHPSSTATRDEFHRFLYERSRTPFEKEAPELEPAAEMGTAEFHRYLAYWDKVLNPKGQTGRLERFLHFEQLDEQRARRMLSPVRLRADAAVPEWCLLLSQVLRTAAPTSMSIADQPVPFEEILYPFVLVFRQSVLAEFPPSSGLLTAEARQNFEAALLRRLAQLFVTTLQWEFDQFRRTQGGNSVDRGDGIYRAFVREYRGERLRILFLKYPMLARIAGNALRSFTASTVGFLRRLELDSEAIEVRFNAAAELGALTRVELDVSDQHRDGDVVMLLTFQRGFKLVYKPRDLKINQAYQRFCGWYNARAPRGMDLRVARVLRRDDYGWVEFVENTPCADRAAVARYYRRAGALLATAYLLGSTDYHAENLLAAGEYPVIIDHETLLQPTYRYPIEELSEEQRLHLRTTQYSVLKTHLLPLWSRVGKVKTDIISGFGGISGETEFTLSGPRFVDVNTDRMRTEPREMPREHTANLPYLAGAPQFIHRYQTELLEGFRTAYDLFVEHRAQLLSPRGPLAEFTGIGLRFVFRPTEVYSSILNDLLKPPYLSDANRYGLRLELLARAFLTKAERPRYWHVHRQDRCEMLNRDVPYYQVDSSSGTLTVNEQYQIEDYFAGSCTENIHDKLKTMGQEDLAFQTRIIEHALKGAYNA